MELVVFVLATVMVIAGAVGVIIRPNPVQAALSLVLTLFGIAVHFVAMEAHFLAAVQIIVYAGAVVVLFLFVLMLLGVDETENLAIEPFPIQRPLAAVVSVGIAGLVIAAVVRGRDTLIAGEALDASGDTNVRALALSLFGDQVFAFEFTSVLLIVAVVGTVMMTRRRAPGSEAESSESDAKTQEESRV